MDALDCDICMEPFDAARRRPKSLPCGHSACLDCLQHVEQNNPKLCPECRQEFATAAMNLPDNFYLMRRLDSTPSAPILPRIRMWCSDCKSAAKPTCEANHAVLSVQAALEDEVERLQVQSAVLAEYLPAALRVEDDDAREHALRVLELARQPGTTMEVSVRGQGGEALTATWTSPPAGQQGTAEAVAVTTHVLVLALARKGLWLQRGEQGRGEAAGRDGAQEGRDEGQGGAALDLPVLEGLDVQDCLRRQTKDELLQTVREHRVRRLTRVSCYYDAVWSLQLLQLAAPHVQEVQVHSVRGEHLQAVLAMPRLRRLDVRSHPTDQSAFPAELPPLPAHHVGLRGLRVRDLPSETTFSLIRRHAGTLEDLRLYVDHRQNSLHVELGQCGLAKLRRLVLWRPPFGHDLEPQRCPVQLSAVQDVLSGVKVLCSQCDMVN